jgi:ketosteroid isomerase-like protein
MMRVTRRHLAAAGALALAAVPTIVAPAHAGAAEDEAAVKKAVDDLTKAMLAADKAALDALVSDKLSYGHSGGKVEDKAEFVSVIAGKKTVYKSITLSEPTVSVAGDAAIARHIFATDYESDGKPGTAKIGVLQVWVKDGGSWKLLARQAFRLAA